MFACLQTACVQQCLCAFGFPSCHMFVAKQSSLQVVEGLITRLCVYCVSGCGGEHCALGGAWSDRAGPGEEHHGCYRTGRGRKQQQVSRKAGCPGGSPGRALCIKAQRLGVDSCLCSFSACLPLYLPYLPVLVTLQ